MTAVLFAAELTHALIDLWTVNPSDRGMLTPKTLLPKHIPAPHNYPTLCLILPTASTVSMLPIPLITIGLPTLLLAYAGHWRGSYRNTLVVVVDISIIFVIIIARRPRYCPTTPTECEKERVLQGLRGVGDCECFSGCGDGPDFSGHENSTKGKRRRRHNNGQRIIDDD